MSETKQSGPEATAPKVLRIGIVQRGKLIEERELKKREAVTIGSSEKATFTVNSDSLPKSLELFEYDGKDYWVRLVPGLELRVALSGGAAADLSQLRSQGKVVRRGDGDAVQLNDQSRGKATIGDVAILFQFKAPAATPLKPVLPPEIRGSLLQNIDAQFAAIFVLVAVLQISFVTYARSLPYIEPTSIEHVDQTFQRLIMPDRLPEPPKDAVADSNAGKDEKKEEEKEAPKEEAKAKKEVEESTETPEDTEAAARARKEALSKAVAGKGLLKVLGANREGDGALADVFSEGGGAVGELSDAFSGIQGVDIASSGGQAGTRGGGSGQGVGIGSLSTTGGGSVTAGSKAEVEVKGAARAEAPEVDGELSQAEIAKVLKRQMSALRDCYERALKRDRKLAGKVVIKFEIEEDGRTSNIELEDGMGSADVKTCIRDRVKYWRFPKPEGGSVFVSTPIVFAPAG